MEKICHHCSTAFTITPEDQTFYADMHVLAPTACAACRSQLRCMHRNERSLYRRTCDLCQKHIVAMYPQSAPFPVYCQPCFFSDRWNALDFGREYQEDAPFFEQISALLSAVPHLGIINKQSENSEYCNYAFANKNCYLTFGSHSEEDCLYEAYSNKNKDSLDFFHMYGSELIYECTFSSNCYRSFFLDRCEDCSDCHFSRDLKGCKHCLFSANLRQKEYHILNQPYSKEEYLQKLASLELETFSGMERAKQTYREILLPKFPVRALTKIQCENCDGEMLQQCKNIRQGFFLSNCEDCAYMCQGDNTFSTQDADYMGYDQSEKSYQLIGCQGLHHCIACNACWHGSDLRYCQFCFSSKNCFGCASLQQQTYCILNKQYAKEEYEQLTERIIAQMTRDGEWGTFFSAQLSPFAYNESMAMTWFPLTEAEVQKHGWQWKQEEPKSKASTSIKAKNLPETIEDTTSDILDRTVECAVTGALFRVTATELDFYRTLRLPFPRLHPEERYRQRLRRRSPRVLWSRNCAKCQKPIQTSYAPERPEIVYCEECYLKAVY